MYKNVSKSICFTYVACAYYDLINIYSASQTRPYILTAFTFCLNTLFIFF